MRFKLLIDGELVAGDAEMEVINPATGTVLDICPRASHRQLDEAVNAANAAFPAWARTSSTTRAALLVQLADAVSARSDEFSRLLTQEQGKPLSEAAAEIGYAEAFIRHFATLSLQPRQIENGDSRRIDLFRRPLGVVGAIVPWNFPILIAIFKLPLALMAGNTVVLKPSPTTPLTTLLLGELCAKIFPPGVVNIITDQNDLGARLSSHPGVAKISFTGSTATGRQVMSSAAATIKRITLELGGNDAAIVLDDVDPEKVACDIFSAAFMNCGQVCLAVKRVYIQDGIYERMCSEFARLAAAAVIGDGLSPGVQIGPLQNRKQYDKVREIIAGARSAGTIIAGGTLEPRPGYFIRPTIVRDITDGAKLVDEEQFGPVLPLIRVHDEQDALRRANASSLGLGGSVWSSNRERAREVALNMEAGTVWINQHLNFGPNIPFCGAKQSGLGVEFAEEGLNEFTQIQVINEAK
jgi:acyl-CoA reductase-like NAD-dependent aldehyde dehydrogenase